MPINKGSLSCWQWTGETNNYMASLGTTTAYGGLNSQTTGAIHPRRLCLRASEHLRWNLQYDRVRRITDR